MKKTKISILSHNLSENCLGRAYILAKLLVDDYEVEIVGPVNNFGIWNPIAGDKTVVYKQIKLIFNRFINPMALIKAIDGDVIYAIKPQLRSFGYGLLIKILKRKKLVLDIDDWELGFLKDLGLIGKTVSLLSFWNHSNIFFTWLMEKFVRFADDITVSNLFLQKRFGGILIPHFRDTKAFDPEKFDRDALRKSLGVESKKVVMFLGTIRKHKGIDTLIFAFDAFKREDAVLMLVGVSETAKAELPRRDYLRIIGPQPFNRVPEFLAVADLVVLMQKQNSASAQGQLPAKIFDAMSMAKPIIATKISDIPEILKDGCGIVISDNAVELTSAINLIFNNPRMAQAMGKSARQRCIDNYSYEAIRPLLLLVFHNI